MPRYKESANKVAQMAHDGLARTINPVHTMHDGDTIFCLSTGSTSADVTVIGTAAALVLARAVLDAVLNAATLFDIPSVRDVLQ
jgi:L-aminopeptidase/D-esterase-like protein